jgi:hypothetical protein
VSAVLLVGGLVVLALQNTAPSLPLVLVGIRTPVLPLAVWLLGAIALGALTTGLFILLIGGGGNPRTAQGNRRRWQVRSNPADATRRPRRGADPRRPAPQPHNFAARDATPPKGQPDQDWEDWGQRSPVSQWQDWDQAPQADTRRPQGQQAQANETFDQIATGWDEPAADYRPAGVSPVDDALEEIAEGWEDWEDPEVARRDNAPESRPIYEVRRSPESVSKAGTGYSYRYRSADDLRRQPAAAPAPDPVDADDAADEAAGLDAPEVGPDGVYDADYRVIVPPSRSLDDEPDLEGDRP